MRKQVLHKIITSLIFIICCNSCKTSKESVTIPRYENDVKNLALKGKVKSIKSSSQYTNANLTEKQRDIYANHKNAGGFDWHNLRFSSNYDTLGRERGGVLKGGTLLYRHAITGEEKVLYDSLEIDAYSYLYDELDFKEKSLYKQPAYPSQVFNPYRLKLNRKKINNLFKFYIKKDSSDLTSYYKYTYEFDDNDKVLKEYKIRVHYRQVIIKYDSISGKLKEYPTNDWRKKLYRNTPDVIDTLYIANYSYNDKDQLVERQFNLTSNSQYATTEYIDHDYEAYKRFNTVEKYTYTEEGLLSSVKLYYDKAVFFSEEYTYKDKDKIVKIRRVETDIIMPFNKNIRPYKELFFNANGGIEKIIAYKNNFETPIATYYYVYKNFDSQGNWLICHIHLDGSIKPTPTIIAERVITYHDN